MNSRSGSDFYSCSTFKTMDEYMRITNDRTFLNEKLENSKRVIETIGALVPGWETIPYEYKGSANPIKGSVLFIFMQLFVCVVAYLFG